MPLAEYIQNDVHLSIGKIRYTKYLCSILTLKLINTPLCQYYSVFKSAGLYQKKSAFVHITLFSLAVVLELIPVGRNLIHIKGAHTGYFLAVNNSGEVYTTVSTTPTNEM